MHIAVMGAGGVGGYFGARLAQAGHDVTFVARGRHLAAMRARGLVVKSAHRRRPPRGAPRDRRSGDARRRPTSCCSRVKLWDTEAAARGAAAARWRAAASSSRCRTASRASTASAAVVGAERVLGGVAVHRGDDRRAGRDRAHRHDGAPALRRRAPGRSEPAAEALRRRVLESAGVDAEVVRRHPPRAVGEVRVPGALSGVTAVAAPAGGRHPRRSGAARQFEAAMQRSVDARRGRAASRWPTTSSPRRCASPTALPHEMRSSMLNDLVAGNRLEAPWLCGAVGADGEANRGVATRSTRRSTPRSKPIATAGTSALDRRVHDRSCCGLARSTRRRCSLLPYVFTWVHVASFSAALVAALVLGPRQHADPAGAGAADAAGHAC